MKRLLALLLLALVWGSSAQATEARNIVVLEGKLRPSLDLVFTNTTILPSTITFTRGSTATDGLYTDAAGSTFNSYLTNVPRLSSSGLLIEEARTQSLANPSVPATQTTGSLGTGTYVFWCIGTGSVTSSAGTATATGLGALTCSLSTFQTIAVTVAGTLTFTVTGSVDRFQLELGAFPTSFISAAGARSADVATIPTSVFAFNAVASTFATNFIWGDSAAGGSRIIGTNGGVAQGYPSINAATSPSAVFMYDSGASSPLTANTFAAGVLAKTGVSWDGSTEHAVLNGGTVTTATVGTDNDYTILRLGANFAGSNAVGQIWFQRIRYFNKRLSDGQLQSLTQ